MVRTIEEKSKQPYSGPNIYIFICIHILASFAPTLPIHPIRCIPIVNLPYHPSPSAPSSHQHLISYPSTSPNGTATAHKTDRHTHTHTHTPQNLPPQYSLLGIATTKTSTTHTHIPGQKRVSVFLSHNKFFYFIVGVSFSVEYRCKMSNHP